MEDKIRTSEPGDGGHRYRCSDPAEIDGWRSVEAWSQSHPGENGCPLKTENKDAADQRKYVALSREEKEMLVDVASGVTISLRDAPMAISCRPFATA